MNTHELTDKYDCSCGWKGDSPAEHKMHLEIVELRDALTKAYYLDRALVFFMDNPIMYHGLELLSKESNMDRLAFESYNGLEWFRDEMTQAIEDYEMEFKHLTSGLSSDMPTPPKDYKNNDYDGTPETT